MNWMLLLAQAGETPTEPHTDYSALWNTLISYALWAIIPAIKVVLILLVAYLLAQWVSNLVVHASTRAKIDLTLARFFGKLAKWAILILAVISVLGFFGVETTSFAVVIGAAGLAIGLAFQGTLSNFAAGIMLLVFRPFKIDDVITVSGTTGKVYEIDLFNTTLDTLDNQRIIVPNSGVFGSTITNITFHPYRRVDVNVGVSYAANIDQTRAALQKAVDSVDIKRDTPEPGIVLLELGDSSVNWVVRVWADGAVFWDVHQALIRAVKMRLDEAGIEIPFPQRNVHINGELTVNSSGK